MQDSFLPMFCHCVWVSRREGSFRKMPRDPDRQHQFVPLFGSGGVQTQGDRIAQTIFQSSSETLGHFQQLAKCFFRLEQRTCSRQGLQRRHKSYPSRGTTQVCIEPLDRVAYLRPRVVFPVVYAHLKCALFRSNGACPPSKTRIRQGEKQSAPLQA